MPNFCQPDIKSTRKILIFPLIEYVNFWLKITLFWPTKKKQLPNWINAGLSKPEGGGMVRVPDFYRSVNSISTKGDR